MKDSIFSWHRILALCILLVYMTMMVPAQELYLGRQMGAQYLEQYLDRADLESSQQRWKQLADQGMLVALTAWESAQTYLLEQDPQLWQSERAALEKELADEREVRLAQWLLDKYIQSQSNPKFQQLSTELQQRSSQWEYEHSNGDGSVVATRQVEASNGQEAKDLWFKSNQQLIQQYVEENALDTGILESQLQELNLDEATRKTLVQEAASRYTEYLSAEYDLILRSETMDLMGNLLYDRESLRAASAKESADTIALTLIQEAKTSTEISVKELFQDFQEEVNQNQLKEGQIHVKGEQWAQEFQRQLEEGLAVWDKVEVEFLSRRSQWEQEALETYETGEEAWLEAFQKLKSARQEWENEIMTEFQQGMEEWKQSRLEQELEIESAQEELVLSLQEEIQRKEELSLFAVTIYDQVRSLLASCYEGVENWYSNWAQKYNKVYSYWKTEDTEGYKHRFSQGKVEGLEEVLATDSDKEGQIDLQYLSDSNTRNKIEAQIGQWKGAYLEQIKNKAEKEILQLESEIEKKAAELEKLQTSTSSDESSKINQVIISFIPHFNEKTERQLIQEQLDTLSENKVSIENFLVELEQIDVSMSGVKIASHLNKTVLTSLLKIEFDAMLWDSCETLLHQDTGWLVLADAGFENLETAINNFFEAVDPTSLAGSSSDLDAEIQRLESTLSYWQDELAVAQALKDYATTTSSSAETAQETLQELEVSQQALQQADEEYKNHQQLVQEAYGTIQQAMASLSENKVKLDEAAMGVEEVKNQIITLNEVMNMLDKEGIEMQLVQGLDNLRKILQGDELDTVVESFFHATMNQGNYVYTNGIEELLTIVTQESILGKDQDELLFRQEVYHYLTEGEPETWKNPATSLEEENRRQLIKNSFADFRLDILNEKHKEGIQEIKNIFKKNDIWNLTTWDDMVGLLEQIRDIGSTLHGSSISAIEQLTQLIIQHWCLQNQRAEEKQNSKSETHFPEPSVSLESQIQQQITELQAMETNLLEIQELLVFMNSPQFSMWEEESQNIFISYTGEQILRQTNSVETLPITDGNAFFLQLGDEYPWKEDFFQLSQEMQQAIVEKIQAIAEIDSMQENLVLVQSILQTKKSDLEKEAFLLKLYELKNFYFQDRTWLDLEKALENCTEIDGSAILSSENWTKTKKLLSQGELYRLKSAQLQDLGEKWITLITNSIDNPYKILSPDEVQLSEENSLQYLSTISSLQDSSAVEKELLQLEEIYQLLNSSKQELLDKKDEFEKTLKQVEGERQAAVSRYQEAYDKMNEGLELYRLQVAKEDALYQLLLGARLNLRIAEEKYGWASRIYLESIGSETAQEGAGYGSPLQRYNEVLLVTNRYQKALEILVQMKNQQQLQNQEYLLQLEAYENALEKSYLMEVILSQTLTAVAKQEETTREAELKDDINASKLFASYKSLFPSDEKTDTTEVIAQGINSPALELIRISRREDGSYTISLGYETNYVKTGTEISTDEEGNEVERDVYTYVNSKKKSAGDLNKQLLESYLTDTTESIVRVDGSLQLSRAEVEVRQWLEEIYAKGDDYLNKLLLASLHLKTYSAIQQENSEIYLDIRNDNVFQADQLPTKDVFHGVGIKAMYQYERCNLVSAAYDFILSKEGGEEDLARYILYRETNLLDKNSLQQREKDLVEWLALDEIRDDVEKKQNQKNIEASIAFASAAAMTVACYFQPWLIPCTIIAYASAILIKDVANSLGAVKDEIYDLMKGNKENALKASETLNGLLNNLQEGKKNLQEQWELLNVFYYGNETGLSSTTENDTASPLSVAAVLSSIQEMLEGNRFVSVQEYENLLNSQVVASLLKQYSLAETSSSQGKSLKVSDVLLQSSLQFQTEHLQAEENLAQAAANVQEKSQSAMTGFYQILDKSLEISQEDREKLLLLEVRATDESLSGTQRQLAMSEYQSLYQSLFAVDSATQKQLVNLANLAYGSDGWNNLLHKKNIYNSTKSLYNTKVDFTSSTEEYTAWLQSLMTQQARTSWADSSQQVLGQAQYQWQLELDLINRRQSLWEAEVLETLAAGEKSWQQVEEKLNKEYNLWRRSFQKELEERQGKWEENYLDFLQKKEVWIQESHSQGLLQGLGQQQVLSHGVAFGSELMVAINQDELEAQLAHLGRNMESSVSQEMTEAIVESLLADSYLDQLIARSSSLASFGKNAGAGIKKIHRNTSSLESHLAAQEQVDKTNQLMKAVAGRQAADYGQNLLEQILASYMESIASQNQAMVDWQERLARDAGYTVDGSIRRTIVVDATLMNPIKETQYLPVYQHFSVTAPKLRKVEGVFRENSMLQLRLAQSELELWGQGIFGANGLLSEHIGVAPELVCYPELAGSKKAAFQDMGSGQMGTILVDYHWNSIQARKGMEELSKAGHDKRLFDDRGLPFSAPTLREVAAVAMSVVGSATGQAWWFGYLDDAIFAAIDLGGGYKTAGEIGKELAIKATSAVIGAGTNWAGNAISGISNTAGKIAATVGLNLASGSLSTLSTLTLQSMDFSKIGEKGFFNTEMFTTQIGSWNTWKGVVAGAASTGVSLVSNNVLSSLNMKHVNGFNPQQIQSMEAMNGFVGSLAGTAVEYAIAGQTTVNLLNLADIGQMFGIEGLMKKDEAGNLTGEYHRSGLVELRLGGDEGVKLAVGTGGVDMGIGVVSSALDGLGNHIMNGRIQGYVSKSGLNIGDSLRSQWGFGDSAATEQLSSILGGSTVLDVGGIDGVAQTVLNEQGQRVVSLSGYREGMSAEEQLALGLVLQHEAHRDGIIGTAEQQGSETLAATTAHTQMALNMASDSRYTQSIMSLVSGNQNLQQDLNAYIAAYQYGNSTIFSDYVAGNYDSSADYWKLMDDGSIAYDGKADLYDVNGNLIYKTQSRGLEGSLVEILYGKNATPEEVEKVRDLLESSFEHTTKSDDLTDRNQWYWNVDSNHGKVIDVSKYEEIYNTRVLVDSITGQADTIRNLNPRTIYDKMVADGTMDKKSGDSVRSRLARMELRVEKDPITVESLEFYENADGGYISYEEFKANNFITGGMPKYEINSPVPEGSEISTLFAARGTSAAGTMKTHAGIDFAVVSGTEVYPMLVNDKTTVFASNIGEKWLTQIQGNNIILESKFSYTYKGSMVSDNIYQSYDHLESSTLENNDVVGSNTLLGLSGATGKWNGKGYGAHLHVDLYTSLPTSPLLNYINMSYDNKIVDSLVHQSSLNKIAMQYYDPYALLKDYKYKIREDAYSY